MGWCCHPAGGVHLLQWNLKIFLRFRYVPGKCNSSPLKIDHTKRKVAFQPSFFRGYVKIRRCKSMIICQVHITLIPSTYRMVCLPHIFVDFYEINLISRPTWHGNPVMGLKPSPRCETTQPALFFSSSGPVARLKRVGG